LVSISICCVLEAKESFVFFFWPVRFTWHTFRVARLAYPVVILDTWLSVSFPLAHFLAAPDALQFRRFIFFTSCVCFVLCIALLLAWWRFLFYCLGAFCSEIFGLHALDLVAHQTKFNQLCLTSSTLSQLQTAQKLLAKSRNCRYFQNPYQGLGSPSRAAYKVLSTNFLFKNSTFFGRIHRVAADLYRLLLIFLIFIFFSLFFVVIAKKKHDLFNFASRSFHILLAAFTQDILPVLFVLLKLGLHLFRVCFFRLVYSPLGFLGLFSFFGRQLYSHFFITTNKISHHSATNAAAVLIEAGPPPLFHLDTSSSSRWWQRYLCSFLHHQNVSSSLLSSVSSDRKKYMMIMHRSASSLSYFKERLMVLGRKNSKKKDDLAATTTTTTTAEEERRRKVTMVSYVRYE